MSRARRFIRLSALERSVLVRSFVWVIVFRVSLWLLPYGLTRKWLVEPNGPDMKTGDTMMVSHIVRSVTFASKYVPEATCLTQALAARKILGLYGQGADLRIGVAKDAGTFEAHAWLEVNGRIVLGKERMHSRYSILWAGEGVIR